MMNFCTYFDSYYIAKGLSLYMSLEKVTKDFHLYVMAFDRDCYEKLKRLNLEHMSVELLADFETPALLAVKPTRTKGEYCWTCGPSVIYHFLTENNLDSITYLDSDLMFMSDPAIIFKEAGDASVVITEQGLGEKEARSYGKYCVQYLTFRNDDNGLGALSWWKDSCIEWCFQKMEKTRWADQKYLDEFPKRWKNVYVVDNFGVGIAPWNMHKYKYLENHLIYKKRSYPYVFFHMHGVKIEVDNNTLYLRNNHFELNNDVIKQFYQPYADLVKEALNCYLNYTIEHAFVHDMPYIQKINYRFRAIVRNNRLVQWIWYECLKKRGGHGERGTKL